MSYRELVAANWGFISEETQKKAGNCRVLLAGCGLGSNIALLAARTGFLYFTLADGDIVKEGNLNRQAFRLEHLGKNKAQVTADIVHEVNPQIQTDVFGNYIVSEDEVNKLVSAADIIVNMVDPGAVLYGINAAARKRNKPVLFPMNIGFGAAALLFSPDSVTLEEMLPLSAGDIPEDFFLLLVERLKPYLPEYLLRYLGVLENIRSQDSSIPQLGIAANINASLVVTSMIKLLSGDPVPATPQIMTLDSWAVHAPQIVLQR